ncbi:hypothetical protein SAMN05216480_1032 [Pustulibacterium marinum]|uniref:Uncharacterized protein n=1 Tax=Pustulibacterium marinum TaxID=1224947 RepID=A0A1I7G054_9FLAO|nr:hypothetical protein [Pustulibacterium marinum]SFU41686.1 hypothetical protein SAMN05216480_1032 [Pustulibacterium marinum]
MAGKKIRLYVQQLSCMLVACLTLMSTLSFTVHKHYCADTLVTTSLRPSAHTNCCEAVLSTHKDHQLHQQAHCCHDQQIYVKGQHDVQQDAPEAVATIVCSIPEINEGWDELQVCTTLEQEVSIPAKGPPKSQEPLYILLASFLI